MTANTPHIMPAVLSAAQPSSYYVDRVSRIRTTARFGRAGARSATLARMRRLLPIAAAAVLAVTGCSDLSDQLSDSVNSMAASALEEGISQQLANEGIELESGPDCSTDLSRDGTTLSGTADCDGTTTEGRDVTATFDGTLSGSGCEGTFTVEVDGERVVDSQEVPECSVNL